MPKGQMNQEQIQEWAAYLRIATDRLNQEQYKMVCRLHADLYAHPYHEPCTCSPKRIKEWIAQIDRIYAKGLIVEIKKEIDEDKRCA